MSAPSGEVLLGNLLTLPRMLRRAGLAVSLEQTLRFIQALSWIDLRSREQLYHGARCLLVTRREDLRVFDAVFYWFCRLGAAAAAGAPHKAPRAPRHDSEELRRPRTVVEWMAARSRPDDPEGEGQDRSGTYSPQESLQRKAFAAMTPEELKALSQLMDSLRWRLSQRRTRRWRPNARGSALWLRPLLRDLVRYGSAPKLAWKQRRIRPRPLVLLADISGSMEKVSRVVLQFFFSLGRSQQQVESFVFATRLSRITPQLRLRNVDRALQEAAREASDWAGGTRIGESLGTFRRHWARRVLGRGAVVLLVSDGWERDGSHLLARELMLLRRRCHRLIWLNPLAAAPGYRPAVAGMAAALPHLDDFLPIHNLESLAQLAQHLRNLPHRRSARGSARGSAPWQPEGELRRRAQKEK